MPWRRCYSMRITIHSFIVLPLIHYDCELWSFTTQEWGFPCGSGVKESACSAVRSLSQEDPLREGMATRSSILAWRIP